MMSRGTRMSKYAWWRSAPALETECWDAICTANSRMAECWLGCGNHSQEHRLHTREQWKTYCMISFACIGTSKPIQIFTRWTLQYQLIIDLMSSFWRKGITSSKSMRRMQLSKQSVQSLYYTFFRSSSSMSCNDQLQSCTRFMQSLLKKARIESGFELSVGVHFRSHV